MILPAAGLRLSNAAGWLCLGLLGAVCVLTLSQDFRKRPLVGDQASHLMQALSLAYDLDLKFEAKDVARWERVGWAQTPRGLIYQTYRGGVGFAKPYLYSAVVAPFIRLAGPRWGVGLANTSIFVLLIAAAFRAARLYLEPATAWLITGAFFLASNAYFYAFVIHPDLFHALLTALFAYAVFLYSRAGRPWLLFLLGALLGLSVSEKMSLLWLLLPIFIVALRKSGSGRAALLALTIGVVVFALAILPYLYYSDDRSWNAYSGRRYYSRGPLQLTAPPVLEGETEIAAHGPVTELHWPSRETLRSAWYYVFGAYTGLLVFAPAVVLFATAALWRVRGHPETVAWAIGLGLMVVGYLIYGPLNYFGGEQSVGNRWFVKAIPVALALALEAQLPVVAHRWLALAAIAISGALIYPHHFAPLRAFSECARSSALQRWFPLELNQITVPPSVGRIPTPVNISGLPRPPRWYLASPTEPEQLWVFRNETLVAPDSRLLYGFTYFRREASGFYSLIDRSDSWTVYGSYQYGGGGEFRSRHGKASLLVQVRGGQAAVKVIPLGHASRLTATSGGVEHSFQLPVVLAFTSQNSQPDRLSRVDFQGDDDFLFVKADEGDAREARVLPVF